MNELQAYAKHRNLKLAAGELGICWQRLNWAAVPVKENDMNSIWKYPLRIADEQTLDFPEGAEVLAVQVQKGTPCLWVRVDPAAPKTPRKIITHGTGHPVPETTGRHIGTYQIEGGALVFHVFDAA